VDGKGSLAPLASGVDAPEANTVHIWSTTIK